MDEAFSILFFGGLLLLILVGPWIALWRAGRRRRRERQEDELRLQELASRVHALEEASRQRSASAEATVTAKEPAPETARPVAPSPVSVPFEPKPPTVRVAEERVKSAPPAAPPRFPATPTQLESPLPHSEPEPIFSLVSRVKSALDIEEALGANWLNKLGIALLVLGVASFLAYQLKTLGPAGKVLVGYVISAVILGAGIWFERRERYRILARAGIGGGWALLFFTTYAMYHVPATHVLSSQALDLVLMLGLAAAMVWHTLRYRSQVVTGLAFLLAFLTVTISHSTVYSLSAGGVLALGLVAIVGRMQWFELEIFGILASYLNHYLWLRPIIEPMQGHRHPFPEFAASAGLLALYWVIFRLSYVLRLPGSERQERISTAAALLNTVLLLALFKYQSAHPEWAFWALLAIGAIETGLGQLPVARRRRSAVIVLSTLGVVLLVAAFPFRYSGTRLAVLWLLESEALLLIGVWTREVVFRRLGALASLLVAGQMLTADAARIYGIRMDNADLHSYPRVAILFAVAAAVFYVNSHWLLHRWATLFTTKFDRRLMQRLSYVAALMALVAAWIAFPQNWTAVAWSLLGLALAWLGRRLQIRELTHEAHLLALASFLRVPLINFADTTPWHGISIRLITVLAVAALFYATTHWSAVEEWQDQNLSFARHSFPLSDFVSGTYTWAASFLLALLAWYELRAVSVAVAWVVGGLILFELGLSWKSLSLRLQTYLLFVAGFTRIFFVNLNASGLPGRNQPPLLHGCAGGAGILLHTMAAAPELRHFIFFRTKL